MRTPVKYTRKQQFLRKGFIFILSFTCGIATTVFAAAVYDATVQSRANTIFNSIQSVAGTLDESDVPSYYNLVRMNIASLIQVLRLVDVKVAAELGLSNAGGIGGSGKAICPMYALANPPVGCSYTFTQDANGCDIPKLVCTNTGITTGTGTNSTGSTLTCFAKPSYLTTTNANFIDGTPTTQAQQAWQNSSAASPCYYSCKSGYSGTQCTTISGGGTGFSCITRPSYLTDTNATFVTGNPTQSAQAWQNSSAASPCYYSCKSGYSGTQCTTISGGGSSGGTSGCVRNGISYISGDVRCDGNKQVRCDNGSFRQIYTCSTGEVCTENPERTSGGNYYTSCKREFDTYKTDGSHNYITISETEEATLKDNAQYRCQYNMTTRIYGNCTYQSCTSSAHEEGGNCVSNTRDCSIANTTNGGRQTWSNGSWGTCQATSSTVCVTGYRMMDGVCKTGAETCNSTSLLTSNGVDFSTRTYNGYAGGGVWTYDTTLAEACTWRCREGYKRTSEISGWRGSGYCVKKNICDSDEYYNSSWTSAEHANQACPSCKGTAPYGGSTSATIYTSSTSRGNYTNMIERVAGENQTWKYIANGTVSALAESCTWTCRPGYIPGYIQAPQTARGPLTCCSPTDSTCKPAVCTSGVCEWGLMTVRFGNTSNPEIEVLKGETLGTRLPTPTRTGYVFADWYTNSSYTGTPVTSTTPINSSIWLYAKWTMQSASTTPSASVTSSLSVQNHTAVTISGVASNVTNLVVKVAYASSDFQWQDISVTNGTWSVTFPATFFMAGSPTITVREGSKWDSPAGTLLDTKTLTVN